VLTEHKGHQILMTTKLSQYLRDLEVLDLISIQKSDPEPAYSFKHIFTQESVYNSLLLSDRRQLHQQVGEALERIYTASRHSEEHDMGDASLLLAHHFEHGEDMTRAIKYLKQAANHARDSYANQEAWSLYNRILNVLEDTDLLGQWNILAERENILNRLGNREAQAYDLAQMEQLARLMNDDLRLAMTYKRQADFYDKTSQYEAAMKAAQQALKMAETADSGQIKARSLNQLALSAWRQFDYQAVKDYANQALETLHVVGDPLARIESLLHLGKASYRLGQYDIALEYMKAVRDLANFIDSPDYEATCHLILGWIYQRLGNYERSEDHYQIMLDKHQMIGNRYGEAMALSHLGWVACDQQDYQKGIAYCEEALQASEAIDDRENMAYSLTGLAINYEKLDDMAQAVDYYYKAWQLHEAIGATTLAIFDQTGLARLAVITQDKLNSLTYIQPVLDWILAGKAQQFWDPWSIYISTYEVLIALGETETAHKILSEAHTMLHQRAAQIDDETLQQSFLRDVTVNQAIETAWQNRSIDT